MRHKTLKLLLACIVLLSGAGVANSYITSGDRFSFDGLNYEVRTKNSHYPPFYFALISIDDSVRDAVIPDSLTVETGTYPVREINLESKCNIASLTIPSTITRIKAYGGYYEDECLWPDSLKYVRISSLENWMKIEFDYTQFSQYDEPNFGMSNPLGKAAMMYVDDTPLTDLVIPEGMESVTRDAFYGAKFLKSVTFPSSLKSIGYGAFAYCNNLDFIDVNSIGMWCDVDMEYYEDHYQGTTAAVSYEYMPVFNNKTRLFEDGREITYLAIPESVDTIRSAAFYNCRNIKRLYIPENVKALKAYSFEDCRNLDDVYVYSSVPPIAYSLDWVQWGEWGREDYYRFAFGGNPRYDKLDKPTLYVPLGFSEAYRNDDYWGMFNNIEEFDPSGIEDIAAESSADYFRCRDGVISFENLPDGIVPEVYSIDGMLRHQGRDATGVLPSGTYIIRLGRTSHKIHI